MSTIDDTNGTNNITKEVNNNTKTDVDENAAVGDTSDMDNMTEKVSNHRNTSAGQSSKVIGANKDEWSRSVKGGLGGINKGGMSWENIKAGVEVCKSDKNRVDGINKRRVNGLNIKAGKKAGAKASVYIDSSTNGNNNG